MLLETNGGGDRMPEDHFVTAMGIVITQGEGAVHGRASILPSMWAAGTTRPRIGVFATLVDIAAGSCPDGPVTPTIDLRVQLTGAPPSEGPIEATARPRKVGNRLIVTETSLRGGDGSLFALGMTTFMNQPIDADPNWERRTAKGVDSLERLLGARPVDEATLELDPTPQLSNGPGGTVQGGAQALLAELATEHMLTPTPVDVVDLEIRYLNRVKVGPVRARAEVVGQVDGRYYTRVTLTDAGYDDRVVAHVSNVAETASRKIA